MKKLSVLMAAMLVVSGAVMAQGEETGSAGAGSGASAAGSGLGAIGGIATGTIVAGAIAAGVLAAVVSNNRSDSPVNCPTGQTLVNGTCRPNQVLGCEGDDLLVGEVCTGTTSTVTVSGTGTVTVPVTFTYPATLR
ncbi:hypothetical protein [Rheinheimera sp. 1928-s]|uniref:hypothetical protein n=1 Tax=Rheinheimera sp. 1928-s TaxID=3033803 RepID=UPI002623817D|nr:hypothetical protein [Rheinheimera sp. 1928-s]MDF3125747.1 hypothetical protein [Rheinheimera sp. 1928-s]